MASTEKKNATWHLDIYGASLTPNRARIHLYSELKGCLFLDAPPPGSRHSSPLSSRQWFRCRSLLIGRLFFPAGSLDRLNFAAEKGGATPQGVHKNWTRCLLKFDESVGGRRVLGWRCSAFQRLKRASGVTLAFGTKQEGDSQLVMGCQLRHWLEDRRECFCSNTDKEVLVDLMNFDAVPFGDWPLTEVLTRWSMLEDVFKPSTVDGSTYSY